MRRSRKSRATPAVSLFPFLAVLICTLGVLIVMLVMAAREAEVTAKDQRETAAEQQAEQVQSLKQAIDLEEIRAEMYEAKRDRLVQGVAESRANRAHLRQELQRVAAELNEARAAAQLTAQWLAAPLETNADSDAELEQLRQRRATLAERLEDLQSQLEDQQAQHEARGPEQFVIVPHKGSGGTYRRPIYVECLKDRLVLQPSGIELMLNEFEPPLRPGNMLDAALLTIRNYWDQHALAGDQGRPYPLLVVRPEGAETFVLARRAMKSWNDEFGYELVSNGKQLTFGTADARLQDQLRAAVAEARLRQQVQVAQQRQQQRARLASKRQAGSGGGLVASGRHGGFVPAGRSSTTPAGNWSQRRGGASGATSIPTSTGDPSAGRSASFENSSTAAQTNSRNSMAGRSNDVQDGNASFGQSGSQGDAQAGGAGQANQGAAADPLSLAQQRGSNWALPTQTPGATGYLRPITVVCSADALEVPHAIGGNKRIPFAGETASAVDPLVDQIWHQIDSWGIAGPNSYWKPQLRVTIAEGGQQRFDELRRLLLDSGLVLLGERP